MLITNWNCVNLQPLSTWKSFIYCHISVKIEIFHDYTWVIRAQYNTLCNLLSYVHICDRCVFVYIIWNLYKGRMYRSTKDGQTKMNRDGRERRTGGKIKYTSLSVWVFICIFSTYIHFYWNNRHVPMDM